jgi:protein involved in polysaccharide export with SLBB domain
MHSYSNSLANINYMNIVKGLNFCKPKFVLMLLDCLDVGSAIGYEAQRQVKVEGEVLYPGLYTIVNKDDRVSDFLKRAGGLTSIAYSKGASLKREGPAKVNGKNVINRNDEEQNKLTKLQRLQENVVNTLSTKVQDEILKNVYVGIKLDEILENPGTQADLTLEEGDVLRIPKQLQTVKVNGEVLYPVTTIFNQARGFKYYISQGGGFSNRSLKRRSYVIYANGSVKSTSKMVFFNNYPFIEPSAELFVPQKEEKRSITAAEIVGISSGLGSLAIIILNLIR